MPRRSKNFSFLKKALKYSNGAPPAGPIANFDQFLKGTRERNAGTIPPEARQFRSATIVPFGIDSADAATTFREIINISLWSNNFRGEATLGDADLGYEAVTAGDVNDANFHPALIRISAGGTATGTDKVSGITGETYKNYGRKSYSIPFGKHGSTAGLKFERAQFNALAAKARAATAANVKSVSHVPEQYDAVVAVYQSI